MRRRNRTGWAALAACALLGCAEEAPEASSETTRTLLSQPRAADLSTPIDASRLRGQQTLDVDLLGVNLGSQEAPVKVIEFVDFGCGYCRQFQLETFSTLRTEFIETEMVEWKFMPFVSGMFANSAAVTEAAECTLAQGPRLFEAFTSLLWVRQSEWKAGDDPGALARERVVSATALAAELGVRSTPTFWIIGVGAVQGALPVDAFRQVFTELHSQLVEDAAG
jgi:protein-disulfide isomerase